MKWSPASIALLALALAMFLCVFLLTPLSGFETRNAAKIYPVGILSLVLIFLTAGVNAVALAVLARRPRVSGILVSVGIFLVLPGFYLDQTGQFAPQGPPTAIRSLEFVLVAVEAGLFLAGIWLYRQIRAADPASKS